MYGGLVIRPFHLLCLWCSQAGRIPEPYEAVVTQAADAIRQRPDLPLTLRCLADDVYAYQDLPPDAAGSVEFQRKRDLDVLQRLDLPPGATLPARTLLHRARKAITASAGLCGHEPPVPPAWHGCPLAFSGQLERGLATDLTALIPARPADELAREKAASVAAMQASPELTIRPHVMMCAVCNYGNNQGIPRPLAADNIVEFIEIIRQRPDTTRIRMASGADWMVCAPCPHRVPELNACVNVAGSGGLSNEKRDLDLLQLLGLQYGSSLPARQMLRLLFDRVPDTRDICRRDNPPLSVWWDGCGEANCDAGNDGYRVGRSLLMNELGF